MPSVLIRPIYITYHLNEPLPSPRVRGGHLSHHLFRNQDFIVFPCKTHHEICQNMAKCLKEFGTVYSEIKGVYFCCPIAQVFFLIALYKYNIVLRMRAVFKLLHYSFFGMLTNASQKSISTFQSERAC